MPSDPDREASRRTISVRSFLTVAIGFALAPAVYEVIMLYCARWRAMWGSSDRVETPILDVAATAFRAGRYGFEQQFTHLFQRLPWEPWMVIACGFSLMILMSLHLRGPAR